MSNLVTKVADYGVRKNIMIGQESYYIALPVTLTGSASAVLKAGSPLTGNLSARTTSSFSAASENAVGILLHEVTLDAEGKGNGTIVIAGCVDVKKLDSSVVTAIGTEHTAGKINNIITVEGSAI